MGAAAYHRGGALIVPFDVVRRSRALALVFAACAALAVPLVGAGAQAAADTVTLSLAEARALAARQNPDLAAARLDTAVSRGALRQAGIFPFNPSADVLAAGGGSGAEPGISQEVEVFNQRGARVAAARAGVVRARGDVANAARLTIGAVDRSFYRLVSATRRSALASDVLTLNQRLADVAQRQLREGEVSRLDYNLAVIELGRARARALSAGRDREAEQIELARLLGLASGAVVVPVLTPADHPPVQDSVLPPPSPTLAPDTTAAPARVGDLVTSHAALRGDSLAALALARRPDVSAADARIAQTAAEVTAARRSALPNLVLRATSEVGDEGRVIRPGVGITLPFFNRNQGEVQARRALEAQARLERAAVGTRVRAEVAAALTTYQAAADAVEVLETTVLIPARQNRQLLEIAYREGKVGLPVLLLIRNQVIDAELEYWDAWLAEREAAAALVEATGSNLPDTTPGSAR